jgi:hypothetical protein
MKWEESAVYYPTKEKKVIVDPQQGMTLRDYFAAKAMGIYMADENLIDSYCFLEKDVKKEVAAIAYMMADAMLEERKK